MPYADPEVRREFNRRYRIEHRDDLNAYKRDWLKRTGRGFTGPRLAIPNYASAAHRRVYVALQRGEIKRPTACPRCGKEGFCEAAHYDYTARLGFIWLCRSCHRRMDAASPRLSVHGSCGA